MKNKKIILGLAALALLPLNACGGSTTLPSDLAQVKSFVDALSFNNYEVVTYERLGKESYAGNVYLGEQEIAFVGSYTRESTRDEATIYYGYEQSNEELNLFYEVNTVKSEYGEKTAKRSKVVVLGENEKAGENEIGLDEAKKKVEDAMFSRKFLSDRFSPFFVEGVKFEANRLEEDKSNYQVNLSYATNSSTYTATLKFDYKKNSLQEATYHFVNWGADNFDSETGLPIDDSQKPENNEYLVLKGFENQERTFSKGLFFEDRNNFFIQRITSVTVYGKDSYSGNDEPGTASAGRSLEFTIDGFEPATALNFDEFSIVKSSNPNVATAKDGYFSAKAVQKGTTTLTIADKFNLVSVTTELQVLAPAATSVSIEYKSKYEVALDSTQTLSYQIYPVGTEDEIELISSDETVLQIVSVNTINHSFVVKGISEGTANVTLSVKGRKVNPSVKKFTVRKVDASVDWLIGEWLIQNVRSIDASFTFKADGTGTIYINDNDNTGIVRGTFNYTYDGINIVLTNVKAENSGYLIRVDSIKVNAAKDTLTITAYYEDDSEGYGKISSKSFKQED